MRQKDYLLAALLGLGIPAVAATQTDTPAKQPPAPANDYSNGGNWLCRPGRQDACAVDLTTTIVSTDGKLTRETWAGNSKAPIDCFYVYPTVSREPTGNSDMVPGPAEKGVVRQQFARFASKCLPYAPMYRQITMAGMLASFGGNPMPMDTILPYTDVLNAWNYYLEHDNHGRGVVLIGHSQGSFILTALVKNQIDGKPIQSKIISALLLGTSLPVPKGKDVGGEFQHMPLCHASNETGCIITYASFRATSPPPANSLFGKVTGEAMISACTNPAALGGTGQLHAYLETGSSEVWPAAAAKPGQWVTPDQPITTPFVSVPGMLTAECVANDNGSYLAVTVHGNSAAGRASDIVGDVVVNGQVHRDWGLHMIDFNLAMGNLVDIVGRESQAYLTMNGNK